MLEDTPRVLGNPVINTFEFPNEMTMPVRGQLAPKAFLFQESGVHPIAMPYWTSDEIMLFLSVQSEAI